MAFHRFHQLIARRIGRQIQLRVQRIELEHIVMEWPGARARSEVRAWVAAARRDAGTVARSVGQIARSQTLRQALRRTGNVERRPVERVGRALVRGVLDVVEDHRVGLQAFGRRAGTVPETPVELEGRGPVLSAEGVLHGHFPAVRPSGRCDRHT